MDSDDKVAAGWSRRQVVLGATAAGVAVALGAARLARADEDKEPPNQSGPFDLVIKGGRVVDPASGRDKALNVGIKSGRIAAISDRDLAGEQVLDATGQVVAAGFIDLHAHGQQLPAAWVQAHDGVTTALELESGLLPISDFYKKTAAEGRPINYGAGAAWTYARVSVKEPRAAPPDGTIGWFQAAFSYDGWQNTVATPEEIEQIIDLVETGLKEGGLGVSINAGYAPGYGHKEYHALAELAAKHGVGTYTHVRFLNAQEPRSSFEALQEQISLAAITGAHMHICHLNSTSVGDIEDCAALVKQAQEQGLPITVEAYPYGAGSSVVGAEVFRGDDWLQRWGVDSASALEHNGAPLTQAKIDEMQKSSPGDIVVMHFLRPDENERDRKLMDLSVLYPGGAIASDAMPWTGSDGQIIEGDTWPLPDDAFAHPRSAGCFSRFLATWVRDRKAVGLSDALRKMSLIPAQILESSVPQMKKKGRLQVGADADVVVFDIDRVEARSTYLKPAQVSAGYRHVVVNGVPIIEEGKRIGDALPGQPVRRST